MTLRRNRTLVAASRRTSIAAVLLLGAVTCASAMSLRYEVPAEAILPVHTPASVHPISGLGAQQLNGPTRISAGVMAGQIVSRVQPVYPPEAKAAGIEGAVVLHAIIGADGIVQQLDVISGPEELQASAVNAVKQWVYKPFLLNGQPQEVETTITVTYSLGNSPAPPPPPPPPPHNNSNDAYQSVTYNIGGSVHPPILIHDQNPDYPESLRKANLSGNVIVSLVVDQDGIPRNVEVAKGMGNEFDEKAVEAVQQYRFKPATRNGEPVPVNLKVEVDFRAY